MGRRWCRADPVFGFNGDPNRRIDVECSIYCDDVNLTTYLTGATKIEVRYNPADSVSRLDSVLDSGGRAFDISYITDTAVVVGHLKARTQFVTVAVDPETGAAFNTQISAVPLAPLTGGSAVASGHSNAWTGNVTVSGL
jgi:hypothetical protein